MLSQLTRILLALVTAIVFTGRMEAAAEHCARLVGQAAATADAETPPCHERQAEAVQLHGADHHGASHQDDDPPPGPPDACQCIAALTICPGLAAPTASARIEPHAWLAPGDARINSSQPDPDLRPPRA